MLWILVHIDMDYQSSRQITASVTISQYIRTTSALGLGPYAGTDSHIQTCVYWLED